MDKITEALTLALEALEHEAEIGNDDAYRRERDAIREALAEPSEALTEQPQEPKKFDPNESFAREEAAQARVREFMRNH